MRLTLLAASLVVGLALGNSAEAIEILSGSASPATEGWTANTNVLQPYPETFSGGIYELNTIGAATEPGFPNIPNFPFFLWSKAVGISVDPGLSIEWRMRVVNDDEGHNFADAGIAFMASYVASGSPLGFDRRQMIYFDETQIGWGDETDSYSLAATLFHDYRLDVTPDGNASVYVDNVLALTRTGFATNGTIAFGDQTNDLYAGPSFDGRFQIDSINVTPVP